MIQPVQKLLLITVVISACRAPRPDGAEVIAAACKGREHPAFIARSMGLPTTDELWTDVQRLEFPELPHRFSSSYEAASKADAMRLAAWWRTQDGVDATIDSALASTPAEVEATLATGAAGLEIGCATTWSVSVKTHPAVLTHERVSTWATSLQAVPLDSGWRLAGLGIGGS